MAVEEKSAKPVEKSAKTNKKQLEKMDHDIEEIPAQDNLDLEDQTQPEVDNSPKEVLVEVPAPPKAVKVAKKHHHKKSV